MSKGKPNPPAMIDPITGRHLCHLCKQGFIALTDEKHPNSGRCARCRRKEGQQCRRKQWNAGKRPLCKNHPFSIVMRSNWVLTGRRLCSSCNHKRTAITYERFRRNLKCWWAKKRLDPQWQESEKLRQAIYYQRRKDSLGGIHF